MLSSIGDLQTERLGRLLLMTIELVAQKLAGAGWFGSLYADCLV